MCARRTAGCENNRLVAGESSGTGEQFWEPIVSKATEQNDKLKRAIIVSVALHIILIALLIWSSFDEHLDASAGGGGGSSIDAVMVDPERW